MNTSFFSARVLRTLAVCLHVIFATGLAYADDTTTWDKTFALSDKVNHEKVTYPNRYGIRISADMYTPKNMDASKKYPALVVGTPYGGVKEQGAGIYAQTMAERGFVAIAFDESFNGGKRWRTAACFFPGYFCRRHQCGSGFSGNTPVCGQGKNRCYRHLRQWRLRPQGGTGRPPYQSCCHGQHVRHESRHSQWLEGWHVRRTARQSA